MSLPVGYQVTYSLEVGHPGGAARHMSLSSRPGRLPTREALEMVADELGFDLPLTPETAMFWLEDLKDRDGKAVNVVQLVRARHGGQA
jgi:hypothetical protein